MEVLPLHSKETALAAFVLAAIVFVSTALIPTGDRSLVLAELRVVLLGFVVSFFVGVSALEFCLVCFPWTVSAGMLGASVHKLGRPTAEQIEALRTGVQMPFTGAARAGQPDLAELSLDNGADFGSSDREDRTTFKGTILLTGANGGLGSAIVDRILQEPRIASDYIAIYAVREAKTASKLQATLTRSPGQHKYETLDIDLGSIASVKAAAMRMNERIAGGELPPIRALILNAGYQEGNTLTISTDGFEMSWQVNFLANFILSLLLLQSMDKEHGRILIIGSWLHDVEDPRNVVGSGTIFRDPKWWNLLPDIDAVARGKWSTPQDDPTEQSGVRRYAASKLCAVMLMHELVDRLAKDPVLANIDIVGLDPGIMPSDLYRRANFLTKTVTIGLLFPLIGPVRVRLEPNGIIRPTWKSARDVIRACFEVEPSKGRLLYLNGTDELETAKVALDQEKRHDVWKYALEVAGMKCGDSALANWD